MANPVCYGDIVYIDFNDLILYTNGFYDPVLYLVSNDNIGFHSFRNGLFQLYPNLSYKDTGQLDDLKNQLELLKSLNSKEAFAAEQLEKDLQAEKKTLEARETRLGELNEKMFGESKGQPIKYGQKVQLFHIESRCFVKITKNFSKEDKALNILELAAKGSKDAYFTFMPKLAFSQEGEIVEYNTPLKFLSCKTETPLTIGAELDFQTVRIELNPSSNKITNGGEFPAIGVRRREPLFQNTKVYNAGVKMIDAPDNTYVRKFISFQDQEKAKAKKAIKNGDYVRISNNKLYFSIYPGQDETDLFFQAFSPNQEYRFNRVSTLFQILEIEDTSSSSEEGQPEQEKPSTASKLPQGHLLEYDPNKKYLLKHVASGKFLVYLHGLLKLVDVSSENIDKVEKVSLVVTNKSKTHIGENYIDRNSVLQFKFYSDTGREEGTFKIALPIKIDNRQLDTNTTNFFGFKRPENYLNKWLRTERFNAQVERVIDDELSSFKLIIPSPTETVSTFLVESLANSLQKFIDFLSDFVYKSTGTLKDFNDEVKKISEVCFKFSQQIYEEHGDEKDEVLTPDTIRQTLLREFSVYNLMYILFYYFVVEESLWKRIDALKQSQVSEAKKEAEVPIRGDRLDTETRGRNETVVQGEFKEIDTKREVNFAKVLKLLKALENIIVVSFKKNDLNHYYCSQFVRVPINGVLSTNGGIFKLGTHEEKVQMKEVMLTLCKEGLWDKDLDALGQLNYYEMTFFEAMEQQQSFHTIYLRLMGHISSSKAPNLQNMIRDHFVFSFISKSINMSHVFPELVEKEGKVCIMFKRKKNKESNRIVNLTDISERNKSEDITDQDPLEETMMNYFLEAMRLIFALITVQSSMLELRLVKYYTHNILLKAANLLKSSSIYREVRIVIAELINRVHRSYLAPLFVKLPKQVQILEQDTSLKPIITEIDSIILDAVNTSIPSSELEYIENEELQDIIQALKAHITTETQTNEVLKTLERYSTIDHVEVTRSILEDIKKVMESNQELSLDFLKQSRIVVISLLEEGVNKKGKMYFDLIKQALEVFDLMENKILAFAAGDIVTVLKQKNLLTKNSKRYGSQELDISPYEVSPNPEDDKPVSHSSSLNESTNKELLKQNPKVAPVPQPSKELSTRRSFNVTVLPTVVETFARQWKTGERFLMNSRSSGYRIVEVESKYKNDTIAQTLNILLDVFMLGQDYLQSDVIHQLRRVASFESLLYKELNKLTILYDVGSLQETAEIIKITFRLNQISREIFFCKDNVMEIEKKRLNQLLEEVLEHQWTLFFMIYDPVRHFRYKRPDTDAKKRFREAFEKIKRVRWDVCFKLKSEAIRKPLQKMFNILLTYVALIKTHHWVLEKKVGFDEEYKIHNYIIRLNILLLTAFVKDSKENQMLVSETKGIIRQFYNQLFLDQTPDAMQIFAEMMRDNKRLLKLPLKYLYDITSTTFVRTMVERHIENRESNGYLCSGIMSFHFLSKSLLPLELYNPLADMKTKWGEVSRVEEFTSLKISTSGAGTFEVPYCYYTIRALMEATVEAVDSFSSHKRFSDIQLFLNYAGWLGFFQTENYLMHYELKNLITKCLCKIYFEHGSKNKFIEESDDCLHLVSVLIADLLFYRDLKNKKQEREESDLEKKLKSSNIVTRNPKFVNVVRFYEAAKNIDFELTYLEICGENIPVENLLTEYVYEGCFDLLFHILLKELEYCKETRNGFAEIQSIMGYVLILVEDFIEAEKDNINFPFEKFESFLTKASAINEYNRYNERILRITSLLFTQMYAKKKTMAAIEKRKQERRELTPLESYTNHINSLQKSKKVYKEQNIKHVADCIADHPKQKEIVQGILRHLKKDPTKLDHDEIIFILKLLRKYIERENSNNPQEEPIYMWNEISLGDLKKIEKIQQMYRSNGLSDILFIFFAINDPIIFRETLLLSLSYMYGGNTDVQRDFYENFREDDDNLVITQIRDRLKEYWEFFRSKETKRVTYLYSFVQKTMFDYFRGKTVEKEVDELELQMKIFQAKIEPDYVEPAERHKENLMFIQTLTFLQALCEGQFLDMQTFLREQRTEDERIHPRSFDFLNFLRHCTNTYYKVLNRYNLSVGNKIMDLIIELVQGEVHQNITVFLYKTFIYDMCRVLTDFNTRYHTLPRGFGVNLFHENFREFKGKVIFLFKTILENRNQKNMQILTTHLDIVGLMRVLESLMSEFVKKNNLQKKIKDVRQFTFSLSNEDFKTTLGDAINIYMIFRYIWEDPLEFEEKMRELIKGIEHSKDFLDSIIFHIFPKLVRSIEIIVETKAEPLIRVWFPVIAVSHYLNRDTKRSFLKYVDRSNSQTKISALIDSSQEFVPQMYAEYEARHRVFGFSLNNLYYGIRFITNVIALIVTGINIGTYTIKSNFSFQDDPFQNATLGLNIAQIVLAGLLIILWWFLLRKRHLTLMWERYVDRMIKTKGFLAPTIKDKLDAGDHQDLDANECRQVMELKGANSDDFKQIKKTCKNFKKIALRHNLLRAFFIIKSLTLLWHLVYMGITIGSIFHPLVAVFQIFDIAIRSDTIYQISASISRNASQFVWTLFLLVLTNAVYSSIGFFFMNEMFVKDGNVLCETSFSCFLNVLNMGLRSGGGVADVINPEPYGDDNVGMFIGRVVFDLSFFIIMIILLLNLIFGMIIDAFGDLRDEKTRNEEDQKNVCFMCGISRSEFERYTSFDEHILRDHNIWSYIYYIVYVLDKEKNSRNNMTDIERLVLRKYLSKDSSWIPIGKSLELERNYQKEKVHKEDEMGQIASTIAGIKANMDEVSKQLKEVVFEQIGDSISTLTMKMDEVLKHVKGGTKGTKNTDN